MATARSQLDILINAKNNASAQLKQVQKDVGGLDKAADKAIKGLGALAAGFGAMRLASLAMDMAQASAASMRLEASFQDLATAAGQNGDAMLSAMRTASRGMVDDTSLIAAANRAMLLGVTDSADEMTKLLEVASARGRAMGLSTQQAFNDLVTGIGRMSPLILDNLGILTGGEKAFDTYAASIGKTAQQLTDAERKQFLLNKVFSESAGMIEAMKRGGIDAAGSWEQYNTSIVNLKDTIGRLLAQPFADVVGGWTKAITDLDAALRGDGIAVLASNVSFAENEIRKTEAAINKYKGELVTATAVERLYWNELLRRAEASLAVQKADLAAAQAARQAADAASVLTQGNELLIASFSSGTVAINTEAAAIAAAEVAYNRLSTAVAQLTATKNAMNASMGAAARGIALNAADAIGGPAALNLYKDVNVQLQEYQDNLARQGILGEEQAFLMAAYQQELQGTYGELYKVETATKAVASATTDAERAFDKLTGKVSSVLSGALDAGVDPADYMPREDAIEENARRLADIMVNGFKGQDWLGEFAAEVPDIWKILQESGDPSTIAAQILSEFEQGLWPELLDKEKAKQKVRRMILGEMSMAELAQEIATELSQEMSIPMQQALGAAQGALGVGGATAESGMAAGGQFGGGMEQSAAEAGERTVKSLVASIEAKWADLYNAGKLAGAQWGNGFMATVGDNIPQGLIDMLLFRIMPSVAGWQAAQTANEGAR